MAYPGTQRFSHSQMSVRWSQANQEPFVRFLNQNLTQKAQWQLLIGLVHSKDLMCAPRGSLTFHLFTLGLRSFVSNQTSGFQGRHGTLKPQNSGQTFLLLYIDSCMLPFCGSITECDHSPSVQCEVCLILCQGSTTSLAMAERLLSLCDDVLCLVWFFFYTASIIHTSLEWW